MCGISFYCSTYSSLKNKLEQSLLKIRHRGPDSSGAVYKRLANYYVGLGHNRLSILDLSEAGNQPMDFGLGAILSYNGEVYNHDELRLLLETRGYCFNGHSDTEVILRLYIEFGVSAFSMLRGMFAFVLFDEKEEKLFVVRDRVGIKPVYLYHDETGLYGSSEIRGLKTFPMVKVEIDKDDIFEFFNQGFLYEPSTGYAHIKKLMPGHYMVFNLVGGEVSIDSLQSLEQYNSVGLLSEKIYHAVKLQTVADVPVGTFFSGGCDSSIIASYAENSNLLFAKYDSDESTDIDFHFSKKISEYLQSPLIVSHLSTTAQNEDALMQSVDFVASNTEELISDYTFWSTYQLSLIAKNKGYKVMLSGMGGDEVFAGYPRYLILKNHYVIKMIFPFLKVILKLKLFPAKLDKKFERLVSYCSEKHWPTAYSRLLGYLGRKELGALFSDMRTLEQRYKKKLENIVSAFKGNRKDKVKFAQHLDLTGFLAHNLMVSDKASMRASIELRVPFLDEAIVAHGVLLPSEKLVKKFQLKQPLKALLSILLPKHLVKRPKTGFNPPLDGLIEKIGSARLKKEFLNLESFVNVDVANTLVDQHFEGKANNTYKLWQLLYFSRWLIVGFHGKGNPSGGLP